MREEEGLIIGMWFLFFLLCGALAFVTLIGTVVMEYFP